MNKQILLALAVSATLGLTACGPSEEPKQGTAEPGGAPPTEQSRAEKAVEAAKGATQAAGEKLEAAADAASEAAAAAKEKGQELAQATIDKAKELIQQVKDFIAENKLDSAEGIMEQLRKLKDSLPQGLQDEIAKLEAMLGGAQPEPTPAAAPAPAGQ